MGDHKLAYDEQNTLLTIWKIRWISKKAWKFTNLHQFWTKIKKLLKSSFIP